VVFFCTASSRRRSVFRYRRPIQTLVDDYRKLHQTYQPTDARYLQMHKDHLLGVRPEEERFLTPELIGATTFNRSRRRAPRSYPRSRGGRLPAARDPASCAGTIGDRGLGES